MQAVRLHGPRDLRVEDVPAPAPPGPDEVLIEIRAVGVCGSDLHYYTDGAIGDTITNGPIILGHEPAGVIVECGSRVANLPPGTEVAIDPAIPCGRCEWCERGDPNLCPNVVFFGTPPVDGALRQRVVHPASCVFPLPEGVSLTAGALAETLGVALHAVDLGHLRPAASAAIIGCGPVGLLVLEVARLAGATPIYAADPVPERRQAALDRGADAAFDPADGNTAAAIRDITAGRGVDVAFDCATSVQTPLDACESTALGGRTVLVGIPPEDIFPLRHSTIRRRGLTIAVARRMKHVYPRALHLLSTGRIDLDALATHTFPLAQTDAAFALAESQGEGVLKAVVTG